VARPLSVYEFQSNKAYVLGFVILVTSIVIGFIFTNTNTGKVLNWCLSQSQVSNILKFLLDLAKVLLMKNPAINWSAIYQKSVTKQANCYQKSFSALWWKQIRYCWI